MSAVFERNHLMDGYFNNRPARQPIRPVFMALWTLAGLALGVALIIVISLIQTLTIH